MLTTTGNARWSSSHSNRNLRTSTSKSHCAYRHKSIYRDCLWRLPGVHGHRRLPSSNSTGHRRSSTRNPSRRPELSQSGTNRGDGLASTAIANWLPRTLRAIADHRPEIHRVVRNCLNPEESSGYGYRPICVLGHCARSQRDHQQVIPRRPKPFRHRASREGDFLHQGAAARWPVSLRGNRGPGTLTGTKSKKRAIFEKKLPLLSE